MRQIRGNSKYLDQVSSRRGVSPRRDVNYEKLMLNRLASRETSEQMVKAVLGEDILRELGMLPKQSTRAMGESESQDEAAERAGTSNLNLGRRAVGIGPSPNPSNLRQSSMATAGAQRTRVTPTEEFLDRVEDFLGGRTEELLTEMREVLYAQRLLL